MHTEIIKYIQEAQQAGLDAPTIRTNLLAAGWPEADVEAAVRSKITPAAVAPSRPTIPPANLASSADDIFTIDAPAGKLQAAPPPFLGAAPPKKAVVIPPPGTPAAEAEKTVMLKNWRDAYEFPHRGIGLWLFWGPLAILLAGAIMLAAGIFIRPAGAATPQSVNGSQGEDFAKMLQTDVNGLPTVSPNPAAPLASAAPELPFLNLPKRPTSTAQLVSALGTGLVALGWTLFLLFLLPALACLGYRQVKPGIEYDRRSGQGPASVVPEEISDKWNWGALGFLVCWGVYHQAWITLFLFVPPAGLIWPLVMLSRGNAWAWRSVPWLSVEHFHAVERRWALWGIPFIAIMVTGVVLFFISAASLPAMLFVLMSGGSGKSL